MNKTKSKKNITTPPPSSTTVLAEETPVSTVSNTSGSVPTVKRIRLTSRAAQMCRAGVGQEKKNINEAFKRATTIYAREREKDEGGMSAKAVAELIENETGVKLCKRTIQMKVKEGNIGTSPLRRGPKGRIPDRHYCNLCLAHQQCAIVVERQSDHFFRW